MKLLSIASVLLGAAASAFGQTIELGTPTNGAVLHAGQNVTAQVIEPISMASCIQIGIALAINSCHNGQCPQPADQLGDVLYAGPWTPTLHGQGGYYQNFTVTISEYITKGPAIFTLTHFCLLGAGPYPFTEFRNASVTVE